MAIDSFGVEGYYVDTAGKNTKKMGSTFKTTPKKIRLQIR